jgi:hypothetical protein
MWFKVHRPAVFYAASARHYGDHKQRDILRDADQHGISIKKPQIGLSEVSWKPSGRKTIVAGYQQIEKVGGKKAKAIVDAEPEEWSDLLNIRGFGIKTVAKIEEWLQLDDPFDIYRLENSINEVKRELARGDLEDELGTLPMPTHNSRQLDEERQGRRVVWIGEAVRVNVRDIFEINVARGNTADLESIKDPELREFAILYARDENDQTMLKINRWRWPRFKDDIFNLKEGYLLLVEGRKPRYGVQVDKLWVIAP